MVRFPLLVLALTLLGILVPHESEARTRLSVSSFQDKIKKSPCVSREAWDGEISADLQKRFAAALTRRGRFNVNIESETPKDSHYVVRGTITALEVCDVGHNATVASPLLESSEAISINEKDGSKVKSETNADLKNDPPADSEEVAEGETEVRVAAGSKIANAEILIEVVDVETGKVVAQSTARGEAKLLDRVKVDSNGDAEVAIDAAERALEEAAKDIARAIPDRGAELALPTTERSGLRHEDFSSIRRHTGPSKAEIALAQAAAPGVPVRTVASSPLPVDTPKSKKSFTKIHLDGAPKSSFHRTFCASGEKAKQGEFFLCRVLGPAKSGKSSRSQFKIVEGSIFESSSKGKNSKRKPAQNERTIPGSKIYYAHSGSAAAVGTRVVISCREAGLHCHLAATKKSKTSPTEIVKRQSRYQACVVSKAPKGQAKTNLKLDCSGKKIVTRVTNVHLLIPYNPRTVSSR